MTERPKFFDDLAGVAGGALSAFSGLRDEMTALVRARVDETIRMLDLVRREEFDAIAELAANSRVLVEALTSRVATLEAMVVPAAPREVQLPEDDIRQMPNMATQGPVQEGITLT